MVIINNILSLAELGGASYVKALVSFNFESRAAKGPKLPEYFFLRNIGGKQQRIGFLLCKKMAGHQVLVSRQCDGHQGFPVKVKMEMEGSLAGKQEELVPMPVNDQVAGGGFEKARAVPDGINQWKALLSWSIDR